MTARIIDGKAIAAELSQRIADAVKRVTDERRIEPGTCRGARGRQSGKRNLCAQQDRQDGGDQYALVVQQTAGDGALPPSSSSSSSG